MIKSKWVIFPTNILIIISDDQRYDTMFAMPQTQARLFDDGVTFTRAYITTPVCGPSRANIMTGMYAHNHQIQKNHNRMPPEQAIMATYMQEAGYFTGIVGKYLMDTVGAGLYGQVPALENLPRHNEEGASALHLYMPWWLYGEQLAGNLDFARGYHIEFGGGQRMPGFGAFGGLEELTGPPSWRPKFRVPWIVSIVGALGCFAAMFMICWWASIVAAVVGMGVYFLMERRSLTAWWGDLRSGILMLIARNAIHGLARRSSL